MVPGDFMRLLEKEELSFQISYMVPEDCLRLLETGRIELLNKLHGTRILY
jgi:hypothetical protein